MARTKAFTVDTALDRAMELFWLRGYGASSLDSLLHGMRIGRQSLYDTFGSKRELYLRALDRYAELPARRALAGMAEAEAGPEDVTAFFGRLVASQRRTPAPGCLMIGAAQELAPTDPDVAHRVEAHRRAMMAAFENALAAVVPPAALPRTVAHLAALADALLLAARGGAAAATVQAIADAATRVVEDARTSPT